MKGRFLNNIPHSISVHPHSCVGRSKEPTYLARFRAEHGSTGAAGGSTSLLNSVAASVAVRRNAVELKFLESALSALKLKEKRALRNLESEMRKYRADLDKLPVRSLTAKISQDLDTIAPPVVNDEVVLKRIGKNRKLKVRIKKPSQGDSIVNNVSRTLVRGPLPEPAFKPTGLHNSKNQVKNAPRLCTLHEEPCNNTQRKAATGHENTEKPEPQKLSAVQVIEKVPSPPNAKPNPKPAEETDKTVTSSPPKQKEEEEKPKPQLRVTSSSQLNRARDNKTPLTDSIARTCSEYFSLLKIIGEQHQAAAKANKSYPPDGAVSGDKQLAVVRSSSRCLSPVTVRLREAGTQFERRYLAEREVATAPKVMWPSWLGSNNKPVQTEPFEPATQRQSLTEGARFRRGRYEPTDLPQLSDEGFCKHRCVKKASKDKKRDKNAHCACAKSRGKLHRHHHVTSDSSSLSEFSSSPDPNSPKQVFLTQSENTRQKCKQSKSKHNPSKKNHYRSRKAVYPDETHVSGLIRTPHPPNQGRNCFPTNEEAIVHHVTCPAARSKVYQRPKITDQRCTCDVFTQPCANPDQQGASTSNILPNHNQAYLLNQNLREFQQNRPNFQGDPSNAHHEDFSNWSPAVNNYNTRLNLPTQNFSYMPPDQQNYIRAPEYQPQQNHVRHYSPRGNYDRCQPIASNFANLPQTSENLPHPKSDLQYLNANLPHPNANLPHPNPNLPYPSANLPHLNANLPNTSANLPHLNANLPHPSANLPHPSANLPHPNANLPHPNGNLQHPNGNLPHPNANLPQRHVTHRPSLSSLNIKAQFYPGGLIMENEGLHPHPGIQEHDQHIVREKRFKQINPTSPECKSAENSKSDGFNNVGHDENFVRESYDKNKASKSCFQILEGPYTDHSTVLKDEINTRNNLEENLLARNESTSPVDGCNDDANSFKSERNKPKSLHRTTSILPENSDDELENNEDKTSAHQSPQLVENIDRKEEIKLPESRDVFNRSTSVSFLRNRETRDSRTQTSRMTSPVAETSHLSRPGLKAKSARVVPNLRTDSDNNPVFRIELCAISEDREIDDLQPTAADNKPSSVRNVFKLQNPKNKPNRNYKLVFNKPDKASNEEVETQTEQNRPEPVLTRSSPRWGSDLVADNVFIREPPNPLCRHNHNHKYPVVTSHTPNVERFDLPGTSKSTAPSTAMLRGEECSDFRQTNSCLSGDFAPRWRHGAKGFSLGCSPPVSGRPSILKRRFEKRHHGDGFHHDHDDYYDDDGDHDAYQDDRGCFQDNYRPTTPGDLLRSAPASYKPATYDDASYNHVSYDAVYEPPGYVSPFRGSPLGVLREESCPGEEFTENEIPCEGPVQRQATFQNARYQITSQLKAREKPQPSLTTCAEKPTTFRPNSPEHQNAKENAILETKNLNTSGLSAFNINSSIRNKENNTKRDRREAFWKRKRVDSSSSFRQLYAMQEYSLTADQRDRGLRSTSTSGGGTPSRTTAAGGSESNLRLKQAQALERVAQSELQGRVNDFTSSFTTTKPDSMDAMRKIASSGRKRAKH